MSTDARCDGDVRGRAASLGQNLCLDDQLQGPTPHRTRIERPSCGIQRRAKGAPVGTTLLALRRLGLASLRFGTNAPECGAASTPPWRLRRRGRVPHRGPNSAQLTAAMDNRAMRTPCKSAKSRRGAGAFETDRGHQSPAAGRFHSSPLRVAASCSLWLHGPTRGGLPRLPLEGS
jgi:hypothetical protein